MYMCMCHTHHLLLSMYSVIGTPFYVMEYVAGHVLKNPALPGLIASQRKVRLHLLMAQ